MLKRLCRLRSTIRQTRRTDWSYQQNRMSLLSSHSPPLHRCVKATGVELAVEVSPMDLLFSYSLTSQCLADIIWMVINIKIPLTGKRQSTCASMFCEQDRGPLRVITNVILGLHTSSMCCWTVLREMAKCFFGGRGRRRAGGEEFAISDPVRRQVEACGLLKKKS